MLINKANFLKFTLSIIILFISFFYIYKGSLILNNFKKINILSNNIKINQNKDKVLENLKIKKTKNVFILEEIPNTKKNDTEQIIVIVKKNDTFNKIIDPFFKDKKIKNSIINELKKVYNLRNLSINQKIYFYRNKSLKISKMIIPIDFKNDIIISITNNLVLLKKESVNISKEIHSKEINILSSLYEDGITSGIPISILSNAIKLYSFDIDFQRDIQKDTKFSVSYEVLFNDQRRNIAYGDIKYINLIIQNKPLEYFQFKTDEHFNDYFNRDGKNVKKALLKTPIDGARLSSSFGLRKHPISGYNKLHKGVDFAAPIGTPIYSAGNGVVEFKGRNGGYGNYIRIRHNNAYKSAYAHLSNFKKGITKGTRVNQGDIIGYVGSTGNSTGPHLHYEIIYNNKQINPMKMKLPSGKVLKGEELKRFKKESAKIYAKYLFSLYE